MSIGWVMFLKALVIGIAVAIGEAWQAYRKRRRALGLLLKKNRKGVYVVSDWTAKVDRFAIGAWNLFVLICAVWAVSLFVYAFIIL